MHKNEDLFLLISTLSKSEKRYFKLFAAKSGSREAKHSILLFDAIEKQASKRNKKIKKYNESAVLDKISGSIPAKQFSASKVYLYNMILKSLHLFQAGVAEEVQEQLHYVKILHDRNLHHQSYEVIAKAKKIAKKYELQTHLLELYDLEKIMLQHVESKSSSLIKMTREMIREEDAIIARMNRTRQYKNFSIKFLSMPYKSDAYRHTETRVLFKELNRTAKVNKGIKAEDFNETFYRLKAYEFYYSRNEDHLNSYQFTKQIIQLLESNPEQISLSPFRYIGSINNHLLNCRRSGKYKELKDGINAMRTTASTLNQSYSFLHTFVFQSSYVFELKMYIDTGQYDKASGVIQVINDSIRKYYNKISDLYKLIFYFNFSLVYFGLGDFKNALYWNNSELNHLAIISYENNKRSATILNLIIHYELQNFELLASITRSLYRGAGVKQHFNKFEMRLLDLFHSLINMNLSAADKKDIVILFSNAKKDMLDIKKKDPLVVSNPPDFDIISWIDSKIEGRTYADCVRRRLTSSAKTKVVREKMIGDR